MSKSAHKHKNNTDHDVEKNVHNRFVNSQPIITLLATLSQAGRKNFDENGAWEVCLCALLLGLDPQCKATTILDALPYKTTSIDEIDFLNTMAHLGYYCRAADITLEEIDTRLLPGVMIPSSGNPSIILNRDEQGNLIYFDPISRLISNVPASCDYDGKIWFFQKYDENAAPTSKFMRQGSGHSWFRALLGRFNGTFAQVMTAGLILNIIALMTPLFIMLVYDRVIAAGAADILPMLVVGAAIAIAFEWKLRMIRSTGLSWLAGRLDNIVGNKIYAHLIGLSPTLIEKASVPAQIARIKTFESVRDFFSGSVFLSLLESPFVFISVIAIAFIAGPLVFVPLFMVMGYIGLFLYIRHKIKVSIRLAAKASSARQQFTIETFEKMEGIRNHGLRAKWQEKFRHLSGREMMTHFQLSWLGMIAETVANSLTIIAAITTIGFGVHMIWAGMMSTGALVATMILVWRILTPFYSLCTMIPRLEQLRNSIQQVNDLMDIDTEAEEAKSFSRLGKIKGAVTFHHVDFGYADDGGKLFTDLSFEAMPGDLVAITGNNGSGKIAVLSLIQSMYHPDEGTVRIDGFDIRQLDAPDLRSKIAYVPRQATFFSGTIIENIRFSNPMASEDDVIDALKMADAWEDVRQLPQGIETYLDTRDTGTLTSSLSTRLSLARAYLHPSPLLLIDELPNTLLSGRSGANLKNYLARAKGKRTIIFCTYRDDFLELADTIVWLRGLDAPKSGERDIILDELKKHGVAA